MIGVAGNPFYTNKEIINEHLKNVICQILKIQFNFNFYAYYTVSFIALHVFCTELLHRYIF